MGLDLAHGGAVVDALAAGGALPAGEVGDDVGPPCVRARDGLAYAADLRAPAGGAGRELRGRRGGLLHDSARLEEIRK